MSARQSIPNHTDEEIKGYIDTAERLLGEAGYTNAERIALLPTIIGLLASKTILMQQGGGGALDLSIVGGKVRQ